MLMALYKIEISTSHDSLYLFEKTSTSSPGIDEWDIYTSKGCKHCLEMEGEMVCI
jgi:hypothetical protein